MLVRCKEGQEDAFEIRKFAHPGREARASFIEARPISQIYLI